MRMRMAANNHDYESRIDYTDREPERATEERRLLFPSMQGRADRAEMSAEMEGYASTEGGEREVY